MKSQQDNGRNGAGDTFAGAELEKMRKIMKKPANWVSREEIKKADKEKARRTFNMACYHLQLSASTLGWPKSSQGAAKNKTKTKATRPNVECKVFSKAAKEIS